MKIRVLFSNSFDCILCSVFHLAGFYTTEIKWMRVVGFFVRWPWLSRGKLCKNSREVVSLCNCIQIMLFLSLGLDAMMKKKNFSGGPWEWGNHTDCFANLFADWTFPRIAMHIHALISLGHEHTIYALHSGPKNVQEKVSCTGLEPLSEFYLTELRDDK